MEKQIRELNSVALNPDHSVVIEACAGSGKTWLLVSRILRLLLANVRPSEILAITFTRKAAQEMQARLHEWLHFMATGSDAEVRDFLRDREVDEHQVDSLLPRARALFEEFLIDQPGITINTFHGWFLQLLKRAPLAAGAVSGANLVEHTSALIEEAWELFAEGLQQNPNSPVALALNWLFETYGLANTRKLLTNMLGKRAEWWAYTRGQATPVQYALEHLRSNMSVAPVDDVIASLFADQTFLQMLVEYTQLLERNGTRSDLERAEQLRAAKDEASLTCRFELVSPVLMTSEGNLRARKPTKAGRDRLGEDGQQRFLSLHTEIGKTLQRACAMRVEQVVYQLNEAGLLCGAELLDRYEIIKRERGLIDYTDVEWRTWLLLTTSDYADYMHCRLDARYKHILVDEFQDTNPLQWQSLKAWLEASADAQSQPRVFLVGDPKQSIYRFRRAEPRLFDVAREYLQDRHGARLLEQNVTRRSSQGLVSVVNSLFKGVMDGFREHLAYRDSLPGRVELLPLVEASDGSSEHADRWRDPLDGPRAVDADRRRMHEADVLAEKIANMVGYWQIEDRGEVRALRYEDIHVLIRQRTHLDLYEQALRHAQIPFIGSRQGGLLDTLEAIDLTALLRFLVVPFADIHLATALRSPVFSASDADLAAISGTAGANWWKRLTRLVGNGSASAELIRAQSLLSGWIGDVDLRPVHDLLDRIYFEADVEQRYQAAVPVPMRAGVAANLRAFMEVALSIDSGRYPSLQGFLHEVETLRRATAEEAPDAGLIAEGSDAVKIMTVHGAKGLEAPVVWLLDANGENAHPDSYDVMVDWPPHADAPEHFSLFSRKDERGECRARLFEEDARLAERESMNLLYVAMTRAQQVFIASGSETLDQSQGWYAMIARSQDASGDYAPLQILDERADSLLPRSHRPRQGIDALRRRLHIGTRTNDLVDPQRRRGTLVHAVLEACVPPSDVSDRDFLRRSLGVSDAEFNEIWKLSRSIIDEPSLSRFFDPVQYLRASNELPYVSADGELRRVDRIVEFPDEVWVLDYKTGDTVDENNLAAAAKPYLNQLESYRAAISELIPGKPVKSALIFSGGVIYSP